MSSRRTRSVLAAASALSVLALAACSGWDSSDGGAQSGGDGKIKVVASTDVWGSVVSAVGGDKVEVKAIIHDPSADPHSYETTADDALAAKDAKLLLSNGGGYDEFFGKLTDAGRGREEARRLRHRRDRRRERARLVRPAGRRQGRRPGRGAARRAAAGVEAGVHRQRDRVQGEGRRAGEAARRAGRHPSGDEGRRHRAGRALPAPEREADGRDAEGVLRRRRERHRRPGRRGERVPAAHRHQAGQGADQQRADGDAADQGRRRRRRRPPGSASST